MSRTRSVLIQAFLAAVVIQSLVTLRASDAAPLIPVIPATPANEDPRQTDVIVYGGTSAGVIAAVQVSRMGKSVILIEPGRHLGGLSSSGLGFTDSGNKAMIGGLTREFYRRVHRYYEQPSAWKHEAASHYKNFRPADDAMWTFEPHVAELLFQELLSESQCTVIMEDPLDRVSGVTLSEQRIATIRTRSGRTFRADFFIDASYEGDLMAAAGVPFTVGREANATYNESLNGNQPDQNIHHHRFLKPVDPFVVPGDADSGLLPGVENQPVGEIGAGDDRIQAFCFRMCMTKVAANRIPFPKPEGYDEREFELLFRNFEAGDLRIPFSPDMMPNGKTDTNNKGAVSTDYIGGNRDYANASDEERETIIRNHIRWQKGLMWTLANHPRVPAAVREHVSEWGLAADEFTDNGGWPHQLYVREARRMVSSYVVTEHDCRRSRIVDDPVGMGSYNMDSHNVRRFITADGHVQNEGDVQVSPGGPYLISYRSIIPPQGSIKNLAVPVCLSSSHIAYGSIRMEPVFMILGQSAATACVLATDANSSLQDLSYQRLRTQLEADHQVLTLP